MLLPKTAGVDGTTREREGKRARDPRECCIANLERQERQPCCGETSGRVPPIQRAVGLVGAGEPTAEPSLFFHFPQAEDTTVNVL